MKKILRTLLLALVAAGCFALMAIGTLAALPLAIMGFIGLFAGLMELEWAIAGFALFGLTTVALCSACCFGGLLHILSGCLDGISHSACEIRKPIVFMTLLSLALTVCIFLSSPMPDTNWFMTACIAADAQHIIFVCAYLRRWRRRETCDKDSSSQPDSPPSMQGFSC